MVLLKNRQIKSSFGGETLTSSHDYLLSFVYETVWNLLHLKKKVIKKANSINGIKFLLFRSNNKTELKTDNRPEKYIDLYPKQTAFYLEWIGKITTKALILWRDRKSVV